MDLKLWDKRTKYSVQILVILLGPNVRIWYRLKQVMLKAVKFSPSTLTLNGFVIKLTWKWQIVIALCACFYTRSYWIKNTGICVPRIHDSWNIRWKRFMLMFTSLNQMHFEIYFSMWLFLKIYANHKVLYCQLIHAIKIYDFLATGKKSTKLLKWH